MAKNEFTAVATAAKREMKEVTKSNLFWLHALNKQAKKNTALDGVVLENVKRLWQVANKITGRGFDLSLLPKDSAGRFCKIVPARAKSYKGGELITLYGGVYEYRPISGSATAAPTLDAIASYLAYRAAVEKDMADISRPTCYHKQALILALKVGAIDTETFVERVANVI